MFNRFYSFTNCSPSTARPGKQQRHLLKLSFRTRLGRFGNAAGCCN